MKKIVSFFAISAVLLSMSFNVFADTPRVVDDAGVLEETQVESLQEKLDELSERTGVDVAAVTIDSTDGEEMVVTADNTYEEYGYGYGDDHDGVMLLIAVSDRNYHITTEGYGITAFTDAGIEYVGENITPSLSEGDYYGAIDKFADVSDELITRAQNGNAYDTGSTSDGKKHIPWGTALPFSAVIGVLVGFFTTKAKKDELKSVAAKTTANDYMKEGSLQITKSNEMFLYKNVVRTEKPKEQSSGGSTTHTSSSGRVHGGGGGSF